MSLSFIYVPCAIVLTALTLPGTLYLLLLSLASMFGRSAQSNTTQLNPKAPASLVIIVPAHNESAGIAKTLQSLLLASTLDGATDCVVIADNCSDETADVARQMGVEVLERHDAKNRGKGFALDFAFRTLAGKYDAFVVVDADSLIDGSFIPAIRLALDSGAEALQVRYQVLNVGDEIRTRLAHLALVAFNWLRPRARQQLGLSCGILGNGFVLTAETLKKVPYQAGSVVEDLEYHIMLVKAGIRVHFVEQSLVVGEMPTSTTGRKDQRARWEGGRLRVFLDQWRAILTAIGAGHWRVLDVLFDLLLLPLGYHVALLLLLLLIPVSVLQGVAMFGLFVVACHVVVAARLAGMSVGEFLSLLAHVPRYLLWKLGMVSAVWNAADRQATWVRTQRNNELADVIEEQK